MVPSFKISHECLFYNLPDVNAPPYYSFQLQSWFIDQVFIFILPFDHRGCRMPYTPKRHKKTRCELCLIVDKVLIFFIVQLNNNSVSPTKSVQFEDFTLIKTLIKRYKFTAPKQLILTQLFYSFSYK